MHGQEQLADSIGRVMFLLVGTKIENKCRPLLFIAKSMLMRGVFAALLRYGEFASQFHLRPLAIPRLGSYTDTTWTDRGNTAHWRCDSSRIAAGMISRILRGINSSRIAA